MRTSSRATIDGSRVRTQRGDTVLRSVVDLRRESSGRPPVRGLRVPAGIAHARGALAFAQADHVDDDRLERIASESGRTRVSFGAGYLIGSFMFDAAYENVQGSARPIPSATASKPPGCCCRDPTGSSRSALARGSGEKREIGVVQARHDVFAKVRRRLRARGGRPLRGSGTTTPVGPRSVRRQVRCSCSRRAQKSGLGFFARATLWK